MTDVGLWGDAGEGEAAPGALESAMRIPGAVAAAFGDLGSGRVLGTTSRPTQTGGVPVPLGKVALGIAMGAVADFGGIGGTGAAENQSVEEVIITGRRYFCLWQAARMRTGEWHAFIQISLDRSKANLAMARLDLRAVAECLPGAVEYHRRFDPGVVATAAAQVAPVVQAASAVPVVPVVPVAASVVEVLSPAAADEDDLPRRDPGRQIPGAVAAAPADRVSESTIRQILWGLKRYR